VCYFNAETKETVARDYQSLAKQLRVTEEKEDDRISIVNRELITLASSNEIIFIFDNVEDYSFIEKYICNRPGSICVLTTARNIKTISANVDKVLPILLEPFSTKEAENYVVKVLEKNEINSEEIVGKNLVEIFGDKNEVIPFHLNKVVSILSRTSKDSVKDRIENLKKSKLWLQTKFYGDLIVKNEKIAKILEFIPLFPDPDSIDINLLASMVCHNTIMNSIENLIFRFFRSVQFSFDDSLVELEKNFLIKPNENRRKISVHRLTKNELTEYFEKSKNKERTRETFEKKVYEKFINDQHNAFRFSIIIHDIGSEVIRAHIKHYLILNGFEDVNDLIYHRSIVSEEMFRRLKKGCLGKIPVSLDSFDITKSFSLIHNVINELHKESKFLYDSNKYDYCKRLQDIRIRKYWHMLEFEMDAVEFSVTVVTIQEIIQQLCDFDSKLMQDYLDKIELNKDNNQINKLKSNDQYNAFRFSIIILDIGSKVIRAHIKHYLILNGYNTVNELINDRSKVSQKRFGRLEMGRFGSLDEFDISESFRFIHNVINELHKESKFLYDSNKYDYCKRLKSFLIEKFMKISAFGMNDGDFSHTIADIEDIIRQLCDFDKKLMQDYLDKMEVVLKKNIYEIKSDWIKLFNENSVIFQLFFFSILILISIERIHIRNK
jgi:hypothetical protein